MDITSCDSQFLKMIQGKTSDGNFSSLDITRANKTIADEIHGAIIRVSRRDDLLNKFLLPNLPFETEQFLEDIYLAAILNKFSTKPDFKKDGKKFLRYYNGNGLTYDLSAIIYNNLRWMISFIRSLDKSRRFFIPVITKCADESDKWPPSVIGIQLLNITSTYSRMIVFTRSTDMDFLMLDLSYFLLICKYITDIVKPFCSTFEGIDLILQTSNLYKETKYETKSS